MKIQNDPRARTSPKAPPREPPKPPDRTFRTFGQVLSFDVACPGCGAVTQVRHARRGHPSPYDWLTGVWTCGACQRAWYMGLLLWPAWGARRRPPDLSPTPVQAAELRRLHEARQAGAVAEVRRPPGAPANRVCLCGVACPMHSGDDDVIETD